MQPKIIVASAAVALSIASALALTGCSGGTGTGAPTSTALAGARTPSPTPTSAPRSAAPGTAICPLIGLADVVRITGMPLVTGDVASATSCNFTGPADERGRADTVLVQHGPAEATRLLLQATYEAQAANPGYDCAWLSEAQDRMDCDVNEVGETGHLEYLDVGITVQGSTAWFFTTMSLDPSTPGPALTALIRHVDGD